jgi:hypothetical protein
MVKILHDHFKLGKWNEHHKLIPGLLYVNPTTNQIRYPQSGFYFRLVNYVKRKLLPYCDKKEPKIQTAKSCHDD